MELIDSRQNHCSAGGKGKCWCSYTHRYSTCEHCGQRIRSHHNAKRGWIHLNDNGGDTYFNCALALGSLVRGEDYAEPEGVKE